MAVYLYYNMKGNHDIPNLLNVINSNDLEAVKSNFKETEMGIEDSEHRTFFCQYDYLFECLSKRKARNC